MDFALRVYLENVLSIDLEKSGASELHKYDNCIFHVEWLRAYVICDQKVPYQMKMTYHIFHNMIFLICHERTWDDAYK